MGFLLFLIIVIVLIVVAVKINNAKKRCPLYGGKCSGVDREILALHGLTDSYDYLRFKELACKGKGQPKQWEDCLKYKTNPTT